MRCGMAEEKAHEPYNILNDMNAANTRGGRVGSGRSEMYQDGGGEVRFGSRSRCKAEEAWFALRSLHELATSLASPRSMCLAYREKHGPRRSMLLHIYMPY